MLLGAPSFKVSVNLGRLILLQVFLETYNDWLVCPVGWIMFGLACVTKEQKERTQKRILNYLGAVKLWFACDCERIRLCGVLVRRLTFVVA